MDMQMVYSWVRFAIYLGCLFLLILTLPAVAQTGSLQQLQSITPEQQQQIMQQMQENLQKNPDCIKGLDMAKLQAVQAKAQAMETEVRKRCAQGKSAEATRYAMTEGQKFVNDPAVKQIKSCMGDIIDPFMQSASNPQNTNICDSLK